MVTRYYRELLSFLSRKVSDRATAADLAQESYARLFAAQQAASVVRDPRALLYKTARNLVIDQGRRGDVRARFATPQDDVAGDAPDDTLITPDDGDGFSDARIVDNGGSIVADP